MIFDSIFDGGCSHVCVGAELQLLQCLGMFEVQSAVGVRDIDKKKLSLNIFLEFADKDN